MNYNITITVSVESEDKAKELLDVAKDAVMEALDYEKEDYVAGIVGPE